MFVIPELIRNLYLIDPESALHTGSHKIFEDSEIDPESSSG